MNPAPPAHAHAPSLKTPLTTAQQQQQLAAGRNVSPSPGLRYPSNKKTIYDRNLSRSKNAELSRAAFGYLFVEMIGYAQRRVRGVADLEKRLNAQGYPLGLKLLDLLLTRSPLPSTSPSLRPTRILPLLQFITTTLWKHLFGRPADALERSAANADEYMISDNEPLVNTYISVPREMSQLNCAAYVAGVIEGVCDGAGFATRGVSAHWVGEGGGEGGKGMWPGKTVFLIRFADEVLEREEILGKNG
ncbi:TRAPP I complex [Pseudovirgaria hyperparasitica]|uniref:Trafficking protein particle complex subunit n=1 Tax=Pseudovirgaria hyperparasitica TaxID=470096 RepID=A0A6A6WLA9_9PEZI|nr:TRAPP I complex [Pseudovirgaria hyperparasitica]KAF2762789.1 TRAPP I complex [Pseudovirgaria hyperparasitica]